MIINNEEFKKSLMNLLITFILFPKKRTEIYIIVDKANNNEIYYLIDKNNVSKNFTEIYTEHLFKQNRYYIRCIGIGGFINQALSIILYYINYNSIEFFLSDLVNDNSLYVRLIDPYVQLIMPKINLKIFEYEAFGKILNATYLENLKIGNSYGSTNIDCVTKRIINREISCFPNIYDCNMKNLLNLNYLIFIDSIIQYLIMFNRIEKKFKLSNSITNLILCNGLDSSFFGIGIVSNSIILLIQKKKYLSKLIKNLQLYKKQLLSENKNCDKKFELRKNLRLIYKNI